MDLELTSVRKAYGQVVALDGVTLRARANETVAVVGPSGCGKSTLLELVCRLTEPDAGTISAPKAALMPQRDGLLPWLSALDNAGLALRASGASKRDARAAAHEHFEAFGLTGFERARPARALRRDAPARGVPADAAGRAAGAVPGRAVRGARRAHARPDAALARRRARCRSRARCCS